MRSSLTYFALTPPPAKPAPRDESEQLALDFHAARQLRFNFVPGCTPRCVGDGNPAGCTAHYCYSRRR